MTITVNVHDVSLKEGTTIPVSSLIDSIGTDSDSDAITGWSFDNFIDQTGGHFNVNGVPQLDTSFPVRVTNAELNEVTYTVGPNASFAYLDIEAYNSFTGETSDGGDVLLYGSASGNQPITAPNPNPFYGFYAGGTVDQFFVGNGNHDLVYMPSTSTSADYTFDKLVNGDVVFTANKGPSFTLETIEQVQFVDKVMFIENSDNANIARLYSAAFDRVPDGQGLVFWEGVYASNVSSSAKAAGYYVALAQTNDGSGVSIANGFMQSSEFIDRYGGLTDTGLVDALYQNVLGRAPDQAGLNFWLDQLSHGTTRAMVLVGFAESPENAIKSAAWLIAPGEPAITTITGIITSSAIAGQLPTTVVTGNDVTGGLIFDSGPGSTNFGNEIAQQGFWSVLPGSPGLDLTESGSFGTSFNQIAISGFATGSPGDVIDLSVKSWVQAFAGGVPPVLGLVNASLTPVAGAPNATTTSNAIIENVTSGSVIGGTGDAGADVIEITDATFANAAALAQALASGSYKLILAPSVTAGASLDIIFAYSDGRNVHIADVNMVGSGKGVHPAGTALSIDAQAVHVSDMLQLTGVASVTLLSANNIHFLA